MTASASPSGYAAGIGSGDQDDRRQTGDKIVIAGGIVRAAGGVNGATIGSSDNGSCETVEITGGTVMHKDGGTLLLGQAGARYATGDAVAIAGGAVYADRENVQPDPVRGSNYVFSVDIPLGAASASARIEPFEILRDGAPFDYGTNDLLADATGTLRIWLPDGDYTFTADGIPYTATVDGTNTTAQPVSTSTPGASPLTISPAGITYDPADGTVTFTVTADTPEALDAALSTLTIRSRTSLLDDATEPPVTPVITRTRSPVTATVTVPFDSTDTIRFYFFDSTP